MMHNVQEPNSIFEPSKPPVTSLPTYMDTLNLLKYPALLDTH